ncbi:MAG: hypothetical protein HOO96_29505 [Polyangiaceae bacterium]|nr:hypothetical protein [Polyangiaceae bacterium]
MAAFIGLDDAPGDAPLPEPAVAKLSLVEAPAEAAATVTLETASADEHSATIDAAAPVVASPVPVAHVEVEGKKSPKAERSKWRRKVLHRADGRELRKHTFYLDAELSHQLTVTCAQREYDLSEAIEEAVSSWLKKKSA